MQRGENPKESILDFITKYPDCILISDEIKPGAKEALADLKAAGVKKTVMLTGAVSGYLSDWKGYGVFFIVVMLATIPAFVMTWFVPFTYDDKPTTK